MWSFLIAALKAFNNIQHPFVIKTLRKLETEEKFLLCFWKAFILYQQQKPSANITLNHEH